MGRLILGMGIFLVAAGTAIILLERGGVSLGRLPGDISYHGKRTSFYFPLTSSILLSVVLSLVLFLISRFRR